MRARNLLTAIVLGTALAAGIFVSVRMSEPAQPEFATLLPAPSELPDFTLTDQYGAPVNADSFRGQWDLLFFGFTHCPDVCPATMQVLASARRELAAAGSTDLPRIVLVSVDPERDTPELMGRYVAYFGSDNVGVTGELEQIAALTSALGIYFAKAPVTDDDYSVDHSAAVLLIDPQARFAGLFGGNPHTVASFVHDLPLIMESR